MSVLTNKSSPFEFYSHWKIQSEDYYDLTDHENIVYDEWRHVSYTYDNILSYYTFAELLRKNDSYTCITHNTKLIKDIYKANNLINATLRMFTDLQDTYDMELSLMKMFCEAFEENNCNKDTTWNKMILYLTNHIVDKCKIVEIVFN